MRDRDARARRLSSVGLACALVAAACGTRVPDHEIRSALTAAADPSDPVAGSPAGAVDGPVVPPPAAAGGGSPAGEGDPGAPAAAPAAPAEGTGPATGTVGKAGSRKAAGCTTNPGATEVGVTGTAVRVGASYAESSLIPGQFRPAMDAISAYATMVNRRGGVCGRGLDFHFHNDGLNAQKYGENVRHLVEQDRVFALLGGLSASDSGGCGFMNGQVPPAGVPDVGTFALNYCRSQHPTYYSPMGSLKQGIYGCCVDWEWLRARYGTAKPAVHWLDVEISRDQGLAVVDALVRTMGLQGRDQVFQGEHSPAQFSFAGDVRDMQSAGVDGVWSSMDINGNVKLIRAMCQADWFPKVVHVEISAYDPQLIERIGADCVAKQNIWMRSFHRAFTAPNAEIDLYVKELRAFCPSCRPTTFGLEGWLSAKLFVEVLEAVGPNLTRPAFYQAMDAVRDWDADGVMGPNTPKDRLIYHCNFMIHVRPDGFHQERGLGCGEFYASNDHTGPAVGP